MTREEFIKQRCEIDKITLEKFEEQYRVVDCNCGKPYCKGYRCLDLDDLLKENQQLKNDINKLQKELNEENLQCSKYSIEFNNLKERNKQLKENWNKLKEYIQKDYDFFGKLIDPKYGCAMGALSRVKDKMQELEQGSDNDE